MTTERELPEGWRILPFAEIAENINERVDDPSSSGLDHYVGLEHLDPDTFKISRWGSPSDVEATKLRFYPGDVIYARRRAYQRKLGVAEWDGIASAHSLVLRARPDVCLPEFLPYFLQSDQFHHRALDISVGSLSPTINWKTLAVQAFVLPAVAEQHRIVEVLSSAADVVSRANAAVSAVSQLTASVVDSATWNESTRDWAVPLMRVGDLLTEPPRNGVSPPTGDSAAATLRSVSISAVQSGRFVADESTEKWCLPAVNSEQFRVRAGDVFVVRGNGNRELVGRAGLAQGEPSPACVYPDLLIRLRFDASQVDPALATAIWNSPRVHNRLLDRAKSSNGIYKINGKDIAAHQLPVPPEDVRARLVEQLRAAEVALAEAAAHQRDAAALLSRLREHLLRGGSG